MENFLGLGPLVDGNAFLDVQIKFELVEEAQLLEIIAGIFGHGIDDDLGRLGVLVAQDGQDGRLALGPGDVLGPDLDLALARGANGWL